MCDKDEELSSYFKKERDSYLSSVVLFSREKNPEYSNLGYEEEYHFLNDFGVADGDINYVPKEENEDKTEGKKYISGFSYSSQNGLTNVRGNVKVYGPGEGGDHF